jgi:hypothetical protein
MHKWMHKRAHKERTNAQVGAKAMHAQMPPSGRGGIVCASGSAQVLDPEYATETRLPAIGGWLNVKLIAGRGSDSRRFALAWNGQRLAFAKDLDRAALNFPRELESFVDWLETGRP